LPYPGIRPYEKAEWPIFCGRQRIVDELLENLGDARFLPVLGTSGCGKSSVIKAGLIATLEREHGRLGASWRTVEMRPANAPMWGLAEALWAATRPGGPAQAGVPPPEQVAAVRTLLGHGPGGIERILKTHGFPEDHNLLLHVDQFEELFRFGALGGEAEAEAFVDQLVDVFDGQPRNIYLVATMRTDFLGDCARFQRLADAFNQTTYLLRRMTNAELREAIERPARLFRGRVEPKLVDRLIRDAGREQDQLPLLEHALMWMWVQRSGRESAPVLTLDHYLGPEVGGVEGALSQHADRIYEGLGEATPEGEATPRDLRPVAKHLFQALSDVDRDGRVIRRPLPFGELCAAVGAEPSAVRHVIDEFRKPGRSFLMPPYGRQIEDRTPIDVSHEALIRQWAKMKGASGDTDWVAEEQKDGDTWQSLAQAARKFRKNPRRLLPSDQSAEYRAWQQARAPNAAWARRYTPGGDDLFNDARMLLDKSERSRRRHVAGKWLAGLAIGVAVFGGLLLTGGMLAQQQYSQRLEKQAILLEHQTRLLKLQKRDLEIKAIELEKALEEARVAKNDAFVARSQKASGDWRTTDALVLAADALASPQEEASAEVAAYAALQRHREVARYPDYNSVDVSLSGPFAVVIGKRTVRIIDPSTLQQIGRDLQFESGDIFNIAIRPDGAQLAVAFDGPSKVELWDLGKEKPIGEYPTQGDVHNMWFSPDGRWLAIADDVETKLVDTRSATMIQHWPHKDQITPDALTFSRDGNFLATATRGGTTTSVRLEPPYESVDQSHVVAGSSAGTAAFDPSGRWLAVPASDGRITLIDVKTGEAPRILTTPSNPVAVAFSPSKPWLAVGHDNGIVSALDIDSGQVHTMARLNGAPSWLSFSPDGALLAIASNDGTAHLVESSSGQEEGVLQARSAMIFVGFVADGRRLLTLGGGAQLWNLGPTIAPKRFPNKVGQSSYLAVASSCRPQVAEGLKSRQVGRKIGYSPGISSPSTADTSIFAIDGGTSAPVALEVSPTQVTIRTVGDSPIARVLPEAASFLPAVAGALDWTQGRIVLVNGAGQLLSVENANSAQPIPDTSRSLTYAAPSESGGVALGIATDGSVLAVRGDGHAELIAPESSVATYSVPGGLGCIVAVDADRRRVLGFSDHERGRGLSAYELWLADSGADEKPRVLPMLDSNDKPIAGTFSRDGRFVAVVQKSGTVTLWDIERTAVIAKFGDPNQGLLMPSFSTDGESLAVAAADGSIFVWPVFPSRDALIKEVDDAEPQGLSEAEKRTIRNPGTDQ
jgi:WD40 repeat protein